MEKVYHSIKGILDERQGTRAPVAQAAANQPKLSLIDRGRKAMGIPAGGTSPYGAKPQAAAPAPVAKPQAAAPAPVAKPQAAATSPVAKPQAAAPKVSDGPNPNINSNTREKALASVANLPKGDQRTDAEKKASADLGNVNPEGDPEKRTNAEIKASAALDDLPQKKDSKANNSTIQMASYDMTINKKFNVSDALYQSVVEVMKKDKKEGSTPRTPEEEKLAAFHGDPKRITHGDVLKARGVTKEEADQIDELSMQTMKSAKEKLASKAYDAHMDDNKRAARDLAGRALAVGTGMNRRARQVAKEEVEQVDEMSSKMKMKMGLYNKKKNNEESVEENKDTPGNSYEHQCAIHVKSESFGEGRTITTQHADPDADGNIAWYDVMFEHGIEKQVATSTLEILVSEMHGHSKKKKM